VRRIVMKNLSNWLHLANGGAAAGVIATDTLPEDWKIPALVINFLIATFLPSFAGMGHRFFYKNDQQTGIPLPALLVPLLLAGAVCGGASSTVLADDSTVEIAIGQANVNADGDDADELDDSGMAYGFAWDKPLRSGRFSGNVNLERLATEIGAYRVDVGGRLNLGDNSTDDGDPASRVRAYLGARIGGVWTDKVTGQTPVTVEGSETTAMVDTETTEQFLRVSCTAGIRLFFSPARDFGMGAEIEYGSPINDGIDVEDSTAGRIFLIVPTAGEASP
jgi:hypothetical protein